MAELWCLGSLGSESADISSDFSEYRAYFSQPLTAEVEKLIRGEKTLAGAQLQSVAEVDTEDWLRAYRRQARPFPVGHHWWVDPREPDPQYREAPGQRHLLRIPARTAFGTGSHASTALMVRLMEGISLRGRKVLDVGTGSGILAVMALESGAESVTALDVDVAAIFVALEVCRLNGHCPRLVAGGLSSIRARSTVEEFDVILANVLPSRLRGDLPAICHSLTPGGVALISGMIHAQEEEVLSTMMELGLRFRDRLRQDEWVALQLEHR